MTCMMKSGDYSGRSTIDFDGGCIVSSWRYSRPDVNDEFRYANGERQLVRGRGSDHAQERKQTGQVCARDILYIVLLIRNSVDLDSGCDRVEATCSCSVL